MKKRCIQCREIVEFPESLTLENFISIADEHLKKNGHARVAEFANIGSKKFDLAVEVVG